MDRHSWDGHPSGEEYRYFNFILPPNPPGETVPQRRERLRRAQQAQTRSCENSGPPETAGAARDRHSWNDRPSGDENRYSSSRIIPPNPLEETGFQKRARFQHAQQAHTNSWDNNRPQRTTAGARDRHSYNGRPSGDEYRFSDRIIPPNLSGDPTFHRRERLQRAQQAQTFGRENNSVQFGIPAAPGPMAPSAFPPSPFEPTRQHSLANMNLSTMGTRPLGECRGTTLRSEPINPARYTFDTRGPRNEVPEASDHDAGYEADEERADIDEYSSDPLGGTFSTVEESDVKETEEANMTVKSEPEDTSSQTPSSFPDPVDSLALFPKTAADLSWILEDGNQGLIKYLNACGVFLHITKRQQDTGEENVVITFISCPFCGTTLEEGDKHSGTQSNFIKGVQGMYKHLETWHIDRPFKKEWNWIESVCRLSKDRILEERVFELVLDPESLDALRLQPLVDNKRAVIRERTKELKKLLFHDERTNPHVVKYVDGGEEILDHHKNAPAFAYLKEFSCIVRHYKDGPECWVVLRCDVCGGNCTGDRDYPDNWEFFKGVRGFYNHLNLAHQVQPARTTNGNEAEVDWAEWTVDRCRDGDVVLGTKDFREPQKHYGDLRIRKCMTATPRPEYLKRELGIATSPLFPGLRRSNVASPASSRRQFVAEDYAPLERPVDKPGVARRVERK